MILARDSALKKGQTYTVTVVFASEKTGVDLRLLVSDLAYGVSEAIKADPIMGSRVHWVGTVAEDDGGMPGFRKAVMRVAVTGEHPSLRASTLEDIFTDWFTSGTGNPDYPGVPIYSLTVSGETTPQKWVSFALGAAGVFGVLYMLLGRKGDG